MKSKGKKIILLAILCCLLQILLVSCKHSFTKEGYIENYEAFVNDVKKNFEHYDDADWLKVQEEFKRFSEKEFFKFEKKLTPVERSKIESLTGQYFAIAAKYRLMKVKRKMNDLWDNVKGMVEGIQTD